MHRLVLPTTEFFDLEAIDGVDGTFKFQTRHALSGKIQNSKLLGILLFITRQEI